MHAHELLQCPQCQDKSSKYAMNVTKVLIILSKDAMNVLISTFVYTGCMHCYNVPSARTKVQSMLWICKQWLHKITPTPIFHSRPSSVPLCWQTNEVLPYLSFLWIQAYKTTIVTETVCMIAISFGVWMCTCSYCCSHFIHHLSWIPNLIVKMQYRATNWTWAGFFNYMRVIKRWNTGIVY